METFRDPFLLWKEFFQVNPGFYLFIYLFFFLFIWLLQLWACDHYLLLDLDNQIHRNNWNLYFLMGLTSPHLLDEATENDEETNITDECTEVIQYSQ